MSFVTLKFIGFLITVYLGYHVLPHRFRNLFLFLSSCFFYMSWNAKFIILLLLSSVIDYVLSLLLYKTPSQFLKKTYLVLSLVSNLGILFFFKYFNFFAEMANEVAQLFHLQSGVPILEIALPVGISFYTFQTLSYTIDVYRGVIKPERSFIYFSMYVTFFPQLVAGPIVRAKHFLWQLYCERPFSARQVKIGAFLILKGFFLKMVIADQLAVVVDGCFSNLALSPFLTAQAVYFFAFQIYCDFYGYTEIARGTASLFGFRLGLNFNRPYLSATLTQFWRRWHMSLSSWLRDYLYISLGGNRHSKWKTYRNLIVTMLLGGLWHGAGINFVIWGAIHGLWLTVEKVLNIRLIKPVRRFSLIHVLQVIVVFHIVCFSWIFFRSSTFNQALYFVNSFARFLLSPWSYGLSGFQYAGWTLIVFWVCYELLATRFRPFARFYLASPITQIFCIVMGIFVIVFMSTFTQVPFVYFQF
jgi:alginate O-acetyltransferase complex protein AlgI